MKSTELFGARLARVYCDTFVAAHLIVVFAESLVAGRPISDGKGYLLLEQAVALLGGSVLHLFGKLLAVLEMLAGVMGFIRR
jgi:hypothetical protein